MKLFKNILNFACLLIISILTISWHGLMRIIELIDGGDDSSEFDSIEDNVYYNHRTGEIDPFKRSHGLYDNKR